MQRLIGSLLAIAGCAGFAGSICSDMILRLKLLKQIRGIYENLKYYIAYQKATIPEALLRIAEKEGEPLGPAFETICFRSFEGGENLSVIWKEQMEKILSVTPLKEQEKKLLCDFPLCLGYMEERAQALALDELLREANLLIGQLEKERRDKSRVVMSIGMSCGILLSILLF